MALRFQIYLDRLLFHAPVYAASYYKSRIQLNTMAAKNIAAGRSNKNFHWGFDFKNLVLQLYNN